MSPKPTYGQCNLRIARETGGTARRGIAESLPRYADFSVPTRLTSSRPVSG